MPPAITCPVRKEVLTCALLQSHSQWLSARAPARLACQSWSHSPGALPWTPPSSFASCLPDPWKLERLTEPQGLNYSHADEPLFPTAVLPSPLRGPPRALTSTPATLNLATPARTVPHSGPRPDPPSRIHRFCHLHASELNTLLSYAAPSCALQSCHRAFAHGVPLPQVQLPNLPAQITLPFLPPILHSNSPLPSPVTSILSLASMPVYLRPLLPTPYTHPLWTPGEQG